MIAAIVMAVGAGLVFVGAAGNFGYLSFGGSLFMAAGGFLMAVSCMLSSSYIGAGIHTATTVANLWSWWNDPNGGGRAKRAARQLGEASRTRVQALVDAIAPQPAGAGA